MNSSVTRSMKHLLICTILAAGILLLQDGGALAQEAESGAQPHAAGRFALDGMARAEAARHFDLGGASTAVGTDDARALLRLRPSIGGGRNNGLRGRLEGQWYGIAGRRDLSEATVYQAYLESPVPAPAGTAIALKAGRQELSFGSAFLLGADTFFDGQSWDAARLTVRPGDRLSLDLFGGRYVTRNSGGIEGKLYGIYGTFAPAGPVALDLYALRDTGGAGATHKGGRHEVTWTAGARLTARLGESLALEAEPAYQFGRKGQDDGSHAPIEAWGGHVDLSWRPPASRLPLELFAACAFGSGDENPGGGRFREFHNPNNDTPLVGDMSVIGDLSGLAVGGFAASGLRIVSAGIAVDLAPRLNLSLSGHDVRAAHVPAGFSKEIGTEANLTATWTCGETISVLLSANRFFTGAFFRDAAGSGNDIDYGYLQVQAAFGGKTT